MSKEPTQPNPDGYKREFGPIASTACVVSGVFGFGAPLAAALHVAILYFALKFLSGGDISDARLERDTAVVCESRANYLKNIFQQKRAFRDSLKPMWVGYGIGVGLRIVMALGSVKAPQQIPSQTVDFPVAPSPIIASAHLGQASSLKTSNPFFRESFSKSLSILG